MDHTLHSAQFSMARKDDLGDDTDDLAPASPKLHSSLSVCRGKQDYLCSAQSTGHSLKSALLTTRVGARRQATET